MTTLNLSIKFAPSVFLVTEIYVLVVAETIVLLVTKNSALLFTDYNFEIVAVASRKKETAEAYAAQFSIRHAFGDEQTLIGHPEIDLVVILAPAPEHSRLAKAAIAAGKDVYCEWPLTTQTSDSEELLSLAESKGVRHIAGLQRPLGPSARYIRDLVKQGYVGKIRSARMTVSVDAFVATMPGRYAWAFPAVNFTHVLSIYGGHFMDMLFQSVGFPKKLTAVIENQFPFFTIEETGEKIPATIPNEVMAIGTLEDGGLFSIQIEGGQKHRLLIHLPLETKRTTPLKEPTAMGLHYPGFQYHPNISHFLSLISTRARKM